MNVTINVHFIKKTFKACIREIAHFSQIYKVSGIIKESWVLISDSTSNLLQYGQVNEQNSVSHKVHVVR